MVEREKLVAMVQAAQKGEPDGATALYDTFYSDVYYYIMKTVSDPELAADLTQDTFIEILQTIGNLKEPAAFVTWSRQIAYHRCTAYFKKRHELLADEDEDGYSVFDTIEEDRTEFIPDEALDQTELRKTIQDMIQSLPEDQRSAILLRYFDEMPVKDIARIQGVSEGTVKSRLNYGRKAIEKAVKDYEQKNGVKLHCAGVVPLLLWLFTQTRRAGAAGAAAGAGTAAAGTVAASSAAGTAAASSAAAGGTGAATAGGLAVKIAAGIAAAAVAVGGIAVAVGLQPAPEPDPTIRPTQTQTVPTEPAELFEWSGYGIDNGRWYTRRFDMTVDEMTDTYIRGHLQVSTLYEMYHDTDFEGTGTATEDGKIRYDITYAVPAVMGVSSYEYWEMALIYDPETEIMAFESDYYVEMDRAVVNPQEVILSERELWSGNGNCDFCMDSEEGHLFELKIDIMTETQIRGTMTVSKDGVVEHESAFTGRGYTHDTGADYEIKLEVPRTDVVWMSERTLEHFWLYYDLETNSLRTDGLEVYVINVARENSAEN